MLNSATTDEQRLQFSVGTTNLTTSHAPMLSGGLIYFCEPRLQSTQITTALVIPMSYMFPTARHFFIHSQENRLWIVFGLLLRTVLTTFHTEQSRWCRGIRPWGQEQPDVLEWYSSIRKHWYERTIPDSYAAGGSAPYSKLDV